jgi:hypothetical protein
MKCNITDFGKDNNITPYNNPDCLDCNECCTMSTALSEKELRTIISHVDSDKKLLHNLRNKMVYLNDLYKNGESLLPIIRMKVNNSLYNKEMKDELKTPQII